MSYATRHMNPSKHLIGLTIVVLVHLVAAYALMTGLARKVVEVVRAPIETKIIEETKKPAEPDKPPPPPPKLAPPPPPFIPPPEVNIALPSAAPVNAITAVTTVLPKAPPPPAVRHNAVRTAPVIDAAHSCEKPEYPSASRRLEEEGTVVLRFLIDVDGRVLDSRVEKSSGFERLDQAARMALGKCKFKPGTVEGKPEQSWASLKYTWRLE